MHLYSISSDTLRAASPTSLAQSQGVGRGVWAICVLGEAPETALVGFNFCLISPNYPGSPSLCLKPFLFKADVLRMRAM